MKFREAQLEGPRSAKLYCQSWLPDTAQSANVILVHGLAEHGGRYQHVAKDLTDAGYGVFALDHLGHGRSEGERCVVKNFTDFINPLRRFVASIKKDYPALPIFLLGHSLGGLIATKFLVDHQENVQGAILSAPAIVGHQKPTISALFKLLSATLFSPKKGFLQLDANAVSRNPDVVRTYVEDPLVFSGAVPACLVWAMAKSMQSVQKQASCISLPLLILQGERDALVNPVGAQRLFDQVSSKDKQRQTYERSFHEILNEPEYPQIIGLILTWLNRQMDYQRQALNP